MRRSSLALAGLGATALVGALWGVTAERTRFQLRRETVPILDAGSDPIKILHLSDLHVAPWNTSAISWIRALAESEPDLVVGTGDFFGHPESLSAITEALLPLAGIPGVVTHGSNDRVAPQWKNPLAYLLAPSTPGASEGIPLDFAGLTHLYTEVLGWKDIDNSAVRVSINGSTLDFVGVGDAHHGLDDLDHLPGTVEALRERAKKVTHDPTIPSPPSASHTPLIGGCSMLSSPREPRQYLPVTPMVVRCVYPVVTP